MKSAETPATGSDAPRLFDVGDLQVDLVARSVRRGSQRLPVNGRSFDLLRFLIERYPETASHREVLENVWEGRVVTADALSQRVRLLRKALGDERGDAGYVASVHGQGYRLGRTPVSALIARSRVGVQSARPRAVAWLALVVAVAGLLRVAGAGLPHAIKHFVRHLF
jgi:DNA-binding winged helix-turn-helix (wHTH) protein